MGADKVHINGLRFETVVGLDAWHRPGKSQPVELSVHLMPASTHGLEQAAQEDSVAYTIDYGKLYKQLQTLFSQKYDTVHQLYQAIRTILPPTRSWLINITLPKGILAAGKGLQLTWNGSIDGSNASVMQIMTVSDIDCRCIVGVNPHERLEKQRLQISITIWGLENRLSPSLLAGVSIDPSPTLIYQDMVQSVVEVSQTLNLDT